MPDFCLSRLFGVHLAPLDAELRFYDLENSNDDPVCVCFRYISSLKC